MEPKLRHPFQGGRDLTPGRAALRTWMWGSDALLATGADSTTLNWNSAIGTGLNSNDRFQFNTIENFASDCTLMKPTSNIKNKLVVWHAGHGQNHRTDAVDSIPMMQAMVNAGYHCLAISMPIYGPNATSVGTVTGPYTITNHDEMDQLEPHGVKTLRLFLDPVVRGITAVLAAYPALSSRVAMFGLSGGGWTTHWAPVVDTRIVCSYPVAGSLPGDLRAGLPSDTGDWEQLEDRPWHEMITWRECYALAAYGGRRVVQILNELDTCCFYAVGRHDRIASYESDVQAMLGGNVRGHFSVRIDSSHAAAHIVSADSLAFILSDMATYL